MDIIINIKDLLPPEKKAHGGRPGKSNQQMLNAILYWLNTGIPWRDLPERYGPWQSVYSRFRRWTLAGVWENVLSALIEQDLVDETTRMLDSTTVKVHHLDNVMDSGSTGVAAINTGRAFINTEQNEGQVIQP